MPDTPHPLAHAPASAQGTDDRRSRWVDRSVDRIGAEAETAAGAAVADLGDYIEDWRFLLSCYASSPSVSYLGRHGMLMEMRRRLVNRLRVAAAVRETPAIEDEPVEAPIVITGLPRTGSTFTHNMLTVPEGNRAPLLWEMFNTVPGGGSESDRAEGVRATQTLIDGVSERVTEIQDTDLQGIHRIEADAPEECIALLSFHSLLWIMAGPMEPFHRWCSQRDFTGDYRYLRQALQVLQYGRPRRRWVLKSPCHLWTLDALLRVFPDATVVWTHRDPVGAVGSYCSLTEVGWEMFQRRYDLAELGGFVLRRMGEAVACGREARKRLRGTSFVDVDYRALVGAGPERFAQLFDRLGLEWGERESAELARRRERHRGGPAHEYDLSRYGLTPAEVGGAFGDYTGRGL